MSKPSLKEQYLPIQQAFTELGLNDYSPAEIHGLMVGFLTDQPAQKDYQAWAEELFDEPLHYDLLEKLFDISREQVLDTHFSLQLLLPEDDTHVADRTRALSEWAEGFLSGFGHNTLDLTADQEELITEGLESLAEVARLNYLDIEANETNDNMLTEIEEFMRTTVLLFIETLAIPAQKGIGSHTLH